MVLGWPVPTDVEGIRERRTVPEPSGLLARQYTTREYAQEPSSYLQETFASVVLRRTIPIANIGCLGKKHGDRVG